jgi:hypothetical protein
MAEMSKRSHDEAGELYVPRGLDEKRPPSVESGRWWIGI